MGQGCERSWAGRGGAGQDSGLGAALGGALGCAFAAPAAAPPRCPPPFALPPLRALLLRWQPPASSLAVAPDEGRQALSVREVAAGSEARGLRRAQAGPQPGRRTRLLVGHGLRSQQGRVRSGDPPSELVGIGTHVQLTHGHRALACANEAQSVTPGTIAGRAVWLARTQLLVECVDHCDGRRIVRQAE